jgi:hypothetical protein
MRRCNVLAVCTVAFALLVVPAVALGGTAHLPKNSDRTIVPNVSIGGVKLGMTRSAAAKLWGTDHCPNVPAIFCVYESVDSGGNYYADQGAFEIKNGKVVAVLLELGTESTRNGSVPVIKGPLLKYKTSKKLGKLGLGSTYHSVKQVFGSKLKRQAQPSGSYSYYKVAGSKGVVTHLTFYAGNGVARLVLVKITGKTATGT